MRGKKEGLVCLWDIIREMIFAWIRMEESAGGSFYALKTNKRERKKTHQQIAFSLATAVYIYTEYISLLTYPSSFFFKDHHSSVYLLHNLPRRTISVPCYLLLIAVFFWESDDPGGKLSSKDPKADVLRSGSVTLGFSPKY